MTSVAQCRGKGMGSGGTVWVSALLFSSYETGMSYLTPLGLCFFVGVVRIQEFSKDILNNSLL